MPKAVWTGALSFGLVTIPVRLYPTTQPKDVRFHLMDTSGRRVRYRRFVEAPIADERVGSDERDEPVAAERPDRPAAPRETAERSHAHGEEIEYRDLMRGIERDDGSVVLLDEEDIRALVAYLRTLPPVHRQIRPATPPSSGDCETYTFWVTRSDVAGCR